MPDDERQDQDVPDLYDVAERSAAGKRAGHLHVLRAEQQFCGGRAVRDHAAQQGKQHDGDLAEKSVQAEKESRPWRACIDQPALRQRCIQVPMVEVQAPIHINRKSRY